MPPTVISSWLEMGHVCILYEWICLWYEHISCPLGVVEQLKGCPHSTGEEYAHSLAHYCCNGCNIALTCIFGIQLWSRIYVVVWDAESVEYCRCMMWYMTILHEGYINYLLICVIWNIEIFPMTLWYQRCDINYCDNTDMICKVLKL